MTKETRMDINDVSLFMKDSLNINDNNILFFKQFKNYPCSNLVIDSGTPSNMYLPHVPKCSNLKNILISVNFPYVPNLSSCRTLEKVEIRSLVAKFTYNFKFHSELKQLKIDAPLHFLYRYFLFFNKKLEHVVFRNVVKPEILWEPLFHLKNLVSLNLVRCNLKSIPDVNFKFLPNVTNVNFKHNELEEIPKLLSKAIKLDNLDICHNHIKSLPSWLIDSNIRGICLKANWFVEFPEVVTQMKKLKTVNLCCNLKHEEPIVIQNKYKINIIIENRLFSATQMNRYQILSNQETHLPDEFICPISREPMIEPVITEHGFSYDKYYIEKWFQEQEIEPTTGNIVSTKVYPNYFLHGKIKKYVEEYVSKKEKEEKTQKKE